MDEFNFGNRLKELRKSYNITQAQLAESLGERRATLSNYENKNVYPGFNMLIKLADFFHVSVDYLTGRTDDYEVNTNNIEDTFYWVKISNPIPYEKNKRGIYALSKDTNIEFYDLSSLKKKYTRIYLPFLECAPDSNSYLKKCYNFLSEFGFLGATDTTDSYANVSMFRKDCPGIYKIDDEFNISPRSLLIDLVMTDQNLFSASHEDTAFMKENSLFGYRETVHDVEYLALEMRGILTLYFVYPDVFFSKVNYKLRDVNFYYDTSYKRKLTFSSLLSYMYYELVEDYVNGYYPYKCIKCGKYFLSNVKDHPQLPHFCGDCRK